MITKLEPTPAGADPLNHLQWVDADQLDPNSWNPNRVHDAELKLLARSMLETGWIQPLLVNPDGLIIDGFHRWRLSSNGGVDGHGKWKRLAAQVRERWSGRVPVAVLDVDRPTAMLMTIRINRAKGTHVAVSMSEIVRELIEVHAMDPQQIATEMGATLDEVNLLAQDGVFAVKGIKNWAYSPAWYPAEDGRKPAAKR
ncbi:gp5 (plasmid) [Amycolatopsis japonica]|uniref:Gp5 n=1 Tax=Amycolatopsis japonica TaxID=208439 RepID=A0A075VEC3_9PSEU|nr:ParB N-terminal domain-containing protein [Amycolatopsis japonica]AIG81270.1 gp5 [Amycolatopsis japonica]